MLKPINNKWEKKIIYFFDMRKMFFTFGDMDELLTWPEKLDKLDIGAVIKLSKGQSIKSIYSAYVNHFKFTTLKRFSVRKNKSDGHFYVIRKNDRPKVAIK